MFVQIASLLGDTSSVLSEYLETCIQPDELKVMLDSQKDHIQLEDIGELCFFYCSTVSLPQTISLILD